MYDVVVVGGGIAGLYAAHKILEKSGADTKKILILERSGRLGGRIHTYRGGGEKIPHLEFGAGRFNSGHHLLRALIKKLGLEKHITPLNSASFLPDGSPNPTAALVEKVLRAAAAAAKPPRDATFIEFASTILTPEEIEVLRGYYGYYSELYMNLCDAIELMRNGTNPRRRFFGMSGKGGDFTRIIEELATNIKTAGAKIYLRKHVRHISSTAAAPGAPPFTITCEDGTTYTSKVCILALPRPALQKFSILRPVAAHLSAVDCQPLCRIYSAAAPSAPISVKTTINNDLRFLIPINDTIFMTYIDGDFARKWKRIYDRGQIGAVNRRIRELLPGGQPPEIKKSHFAYWDCGVGYWRAGANSAEIAARMLRPIENIDLFICGENYSEKHQQWIEGSLYTATKVAAMII
jgi:glycine/D-amino acid oxidase-like deaminating enzyme